MGLAVPPNVLIVDPIGYEEILCLMVNSRGVITDSGTVVEETCVLQVPSLQMRKSTERPQVYDVGSSVKLIPPNRKNIRTRSCSGNWKRSLESAGRKRSGMGNHLNASQKTCIDASCKMIFGRHKPNQYHVPIARSFRDDGLD